MTKHPLSHLFIDDCAQVDTDDQSPLVNDTHGWVSLADFAEYQTNRILTIKPRRRTFLHQSDAGYDWAAGREFVVVSDSSPYLNQVVAVDEAHNLKRYGYTHVHIHYNTHSVPLEIEL